MEVPIFIRSINMGFLKKLEAINKTIMVVMIFIRSINMGFLKKLVLQVLEGKKHNIKPIKVS
jgi:hypothetical protein